MKSLSKNPIYQAAKSLALSAHQGERGIFHQEEVAKLSVSRYKLNCDKRGLKPDFDISLRLVVTGLLHDVIRDGGFNINLVAKALSKSAHDCSDPLIVFDVIRALDHLTRREDEDYLGLVLRAKTYWLSKEVKMSDALHHIITIEDQQCYDKYQLAHYILSN